MLRNRGLVITFTSLTIVQTAVPIALQKMTRAIIYGELFYAAITLCLAIGLAVAIYQVWRRPFGSVAMMAFYLGLTLLIGYDVLVWRVIEDSV